MSSANGVPWPPLPAFPKVAISQDVYANPATPLTAIGSGKKALPPVKDPKKK